MIDSFHFFYKMISILFFKIEWSFPYYFLGTTNNQSPTYKCKHERTFSEFPLRPETSTHSAKNHIFSRPAKIKHSLHTHAFIYIIYVFSNPRSPQPFFCLRVSLFGPSSCRAGPFVSYVFVRRKHFFFPPAFPNKLLLFVLFPFIYLPDFVERVLMVGCGCATKERTSTPKTAQFCGEVKISAIFETMQNFWSICSQQDSHVVGCFERMCVFWLGVRWNVKSF